MNVIGNLSRAALVAGLLTIIGHQANAQNTLEGKLGQARLQTQDVGDYNFFSLYRALSSEEYHVRRNPDSGNDDYGIAYKSLVLKFSHELVKLAGRYGISIDECVDDASNAQISGIGVFTFLDEIVLQYPIVNSIEDTVWVRLVFYPNDIVLENLWGNNRDGNRRLKIEKTLQPDGNIKSTLITLPVNQDFPYQSDMKGYDFWQVHNRAKEIRKFYYRSMHHKSYIKDQFENIMDFMFRRYGINPPVYDINNDSLFADGGIISAAYYIGNQRMVLSVRDRPQATLEAVDIAPGMIKPEIVFPVGYKK